MASKEKNPKNTQSQDLKGDQFGTTSQNENDQERDVRGLEPMDKKECGSKGC